MNVQVITGHVLTDTGKYNDKQNLQTVDGIYAIIGHSELTRDDIDAIGEQIDTELSSF